MIDAGCPQCGFDASSITGADVPALTRATAQRFRLALARPAASTRPAPDVWSPLEYSAHVRDVCRRFDERVRLMLAEDDPQFANWDQDATALADRYWTQDPTAVSAELAAAADEMAETLSAVRAEQWSRPGRRSNGSAFTVDSLARYFVHDLVHHAHDVGA